MSIPVNKFIRDAHFMSRLIYESPMDWFEKLTGFRETGYDDTRAKLPDSKMCAEIVKAAGGED